MTIDRTRHATDDLERDPQLARLLEHEYATNEMHADRLARSIIAAVRRRPNDARPWWAVIATWSRAVVPIGVAVAATASFLLLRTSTANLAAAASSRADGASRDVTAVEIVATRTTSGDVVAALLPTTADDLLQAAVRR